MAKIIKRQIDIDNKTYFWTMKDGRSLYVTQYIRVFESGCKQSILYIDPYSWHFEVCPKNIEQAIRFALSQAWNPRCNGEKMYVGMDSDGKWAVLGQS